jgi:hypothetical protein
MSRLSTVANFARYAPVTGLVVYLDNVGMTQRAGFMPRINQGLSGICFDRGSPIMAQRTESLGDEIMSSADQTAPEDYEDDR